MWLVIFSKLETRKNRESTKKYTTALPLRGTLECNVARKARHNFSNSHENSITIISFCHLC